MLEAKVLAVTIDPTEQHNVLVLLQSNGKILPILIGASEGLSIDLALRGKKPRDHFHTTSYVTYLQV